MIEFDFQVMTAVTKLNDIEPLDLRAITSIPQVVSILARQLEKELF